MNDFFDKGEAKNWKELTKKDILIDKLNEAVIRSESVKDFHVEGNPETTLTDKDIRKLKTFAVKLPETVIEEYDKLYEASSLRFKNEFMEHLLQTYKVNLLKEGKLNEELIHPTIAKQMSGDVFELAKLTQMINELFVFQLEKFSQNHYELERIKRENERLKENAKPQTKNNGTVVSEYIHCQMEQSAGNMLFLGTSGSGKSHASKLEIKKAISGGKQVIVLDLQGEYSHFAEKVGGQVITLDEHDSINPFEFFPHKDSNESVNTVNPLTNKILFLHSLIECLICRQLSAAERKLVLSAIEDTYKKYNITRDTVSTEGMKMPILSDLEQQLRKCGQGISLADELEPYTSGFLNLFNRQRNILLYKTPLIVFNLKNMEKSLSTASSLIVLDFVFSLIRNKTLSNTLVVIDEIWSLLNTKQSSDYLLAFYKASKKYNCQFILTTQQPVDFLSNSGEEFIRHTQTISFFRQHANDIGKLKGYRLLSDDLCQFLRTSKRGEAIVLIQNEADSFPMQLFFQYPEDKDASTDPNDMILF